MDPAIAGAWIGLGGGIVGSLGGAVAGYQLSTRSERRAHRSTTAEHLADIRPLLYAPNTLLDLQAKIDRLAVSLAGAGVGSEAVAALRRIAERCNRRSTKFARDTPAEPPDVPEDDLARYDELVLALGAQLQRTGRRGKRANALKGAVDGIPQPR